MQKFKVGDTVRIAHSQYNSIGPLKGERAVITEIKPHCLYVRHSRNTDEWAVYAREVVLIAGGVAPTIAADLRLTPQAKTILQHLKRHKNGISPAKADAVYGITRLASCIHEIRRKAGYNVSTDVLRDDRDHKYAVYKLVKETVH